MLKTCGLFQVLASINKTAVSVHEEIIGLAGTYCFTVTFSQVGSVVNTRGCLTDFERPCDTAVLCELTHAAKPVSSDRVFTARFSCSLSQPCRAGAGPLTLIRCRRLAFSL